MEANSNDKYPGVEQEKRESRINKSEYDSDESDEDFCPDKEVSPASETESSAAQTDESEAEECQRDKQKSEKKRKKQNSTKKTKTRIKKIGDGCDSDSDNDDSESTRRNTRFMEAKNGNCKSVEEKDELPSDEEQDKSRTDALWADFLSDVRPTQPAVPKNSEKGQMEGNLNEPKPSASKSVALTEKKITVVEVLDFAGEEVKVQKTINVDSIKENKTATAAASSGNRLPGHSPVAGLKRPGCGLGGTSGVGSLLSQIGKKKKISVLEKSKLDWNSFKQDEGINEQLQTFNKGKDGFLERQDFLQRTDLRQFEIEKNLRQSRRNN